MSLAFPAGGTRELHGAGGGRSPQLVNEMIFSCLKIADHTSVQVVRELTGLVEGANALLSGSKGLEHKYLSLPSYASQRLSLALEVCLVSLSRVLHAVPLPWK